MNDETTEPPFWLVWNPQGHRPMYKHDREQSALDEATRLAREHPGHDFYVLQPISVTKLQNTVTHRFASVPF